MNINIYIYTLQNRHMIDYVDSDSDYSPRLSLDVELNLAKVLNDGSLIAMHGYSNDISLVAGVVAGGRGVALGGVYSAISRHRGRGRQCVVGGVRARFAFISGMQCKSRSSRGVAESLRPEAWLNA